MRAHSLLHFSLHSPQVIWGLGSKWTSGLTALDVVLTHTTHTHTRPPQASKCSTEKKKSFITPEDTETYGPRTPPCAWIHQAWVLHKTHRSPHPPSLTLWGRIVQTLLSQLAPGRGKKKKKNNWYSRTKTTSRAVKGNYDCTLDSELAVSKLIFNTGYCTLTHDTSCLNDRRFPESPLCCLPPVQPFQKENVLM